VRLAEDAWNGRDPEKVAGAYTVDSVWRNRSEFLSGREAIIQFLRRKWAKELDYDSSRSYGLFVKIGSPSDLPTNGTMIMETGFDPTETRIGNLTKTVSWLGA
jgi:hypothetical protein